MSITIGYFFNSPLSLPDLAKEFRGWIGCNLQAYEGDPDDLFAHFLGVEFSLGTHELENDGQIDYENYRYQASTRTPWAAADFRALQFIVMGALVYALHRRVKITGMLVFDLGRLVARYEERTGPDGAAILFDATANEQVIFPAYLATLFSRVPADRLNGSMEKSVADYLNSICRDIHKR